VPKRCIVFIVFLNVLALRQDSRPLYCLLSALYCNKVVAYPSFMPAFVTQSYLTLFPIFSRPFGLPLLYILLYITSSQHNQCRPIFYQAFLFRLYSYLYKIISKN
jgi:hypothetical protein